MATVPAETDADQRSAPLVAQHLRVPFILLVLCFAAWGMAANLTDILVGVFRGIFSMSNFQSSLVQFAYYGAYFLLAIPAAFINSRFGFKAGVLVGLGLAALGGFLFIPASQLLAYNMFLLALFVLAAGLSILETSANPFVIAMGDEASSTQRLNLAQSFNPVGANLGVLMGAVLILPNLTPEESKTIMSEAELVASQEADLLLVLRPYLVIAAILVAIWLLIAFRKMQLPSQPEAVDLTEGGGGTLARLWANRHYRYGVLAQFFNVAAQTCTWTFTILYAQDVAGTSSAAAGWWLQASLLIFLVSRFVMTWLLGIVRPALLLLVMALFGVACCLTSMFVLNVVGLIAVVAISAALSLMFPTIYGLALQGLGPDAKFGSAGLVMAILGGALVPMIHAAVMDSAGSAAGYVVPGVCLALVAAYAVFDLRTDRPDAAPAPAPEVGAQEW
ncbi:L-fucose:H+ symporter permease [Serinicoccus kebangsaanensis]|uniref:L-fucose:H+ symporter permease n=1 Tax=Serinicoccus kebangsaanensis TaxID=2602069 RepID=UPI00124E4199|nr:L-fucose:H+ symporter permease [Serinicoccus kebangsaanensis]